MSSDKPKQILPNSTRYFDPHPPKSKTVKKSRLLGKGIAAFVLLSTLVGGGMWFFNRGTIQGVPVSIVLKFVADETARNAYFTGQNQMLHARLQAMGIEEDIKAFYRPQISDEVELDWYIHQLLYERTGYVGKSYRVDAHGRLQLITRKERQFPVWYALATRVGLVTSSREDNGNWFVLTSEGKWVSYEQMSTQYPLGNLRKRVRQANRQKAKRANEYN